MTTNPYTALFGENPHAGLPAREQEFRRKVDECAAWVVEHGRLPGRSDGSLGIWVLNVRSGRIRVTPGRRTYINEMLPSWQAPRRYSDEAFFARVDECAAWVAEHGRMPREKEQWGAMLKKARRGEVSDARLAYINEMLPGWNAPSRYSDEAFFARVDECAAWVAERGRLPVASDGPVGQWLNGLRAGNNTITRTRRDYLTARLPGWDAPGRRSDEAFFAKVDECAAWVTEHGRWPRSKEGQYGQWLVRLRHSTTISPARRAYLDQRLPGWETSGRTAR